MWHSCSSGSARHKAGFNTKVRKRYFDAPWMRALEIDVLNALLENLHPESCLELGFRRFNLVLSKKMRRLKQWIASENNRQIPEDVRARNCDPRVDVVFIESESK
jgi:hypothetical protein